MPLPIRSLLISACLLALVACDSAEERAEKHFQSGLELLDSGDVHRAIVEFRNVLRLDEDHNEARLTYARAARNIGNIPESYSQYLRLAEAFPNDIEPRLALSEMAILAQDWNEAERHGAALIRVQGENPDEETRIIDLALQFRQAFQEQDRAALREITRQVEELAFSNPDNPIISRLLIEGYANDNRIDDAIVVAEKMLSDDSDDPLFYQVLAELLVAKRDWDALETHFRRTIQKFPDNLEAKGALIRLLVREGRADSAEAFLRDEIAISENKAETHLSLISLIRSERGAEAALEEIDIALAAYENTPILVALKAGLLFDQGQREEAIGLMQTITDNVEPSAEVDRFRITLAKMLVATGNDVGARTLVEQVLEHDVSQVSALKMRAEWQIEADEADAAIATLRLALDQEPEDAEAMTIMARAHERNGDRQLSQDLLALAVEASRYAPAESLRFARLQISQERYSSAEETLINALRRTPQDFQLLTTLGQVYLATSDWGRMEQTIATLRRLGNSPALLAAEDFQLKMIERRQGRDQGISFLEQLVRDGTDSTTATVALIRARLTEDRTEEALALAQELATNNPQNPRALLILGNTQLAINSFDDAESTFRALVKTTNNNPEAILQLMRALSAQGRIDDASTQADIGLAQAPDHPQLLWAKASILEKQNDIDGAIDIYERLYAQNTDAQVIANNLASLLVTYREDDASLERAFAVGKRLRNTDIPPFQDTYGWILYRQGKAEEAISYLEPAAAALSTDPIVQYHLGKAYLEVGRDADALKQFERAISLADPNDPRAQIIEATSQIERLSGKQSE